MHAAEKMQDFYSVDFDSLPKIQSWSNVCNAARILIFARTIRAYDC